MVDGTYFESAPSPPPISAVPPPLPAQVRVGVSMVPRHQRRLTIAFRGILLLPLLFVLGALEVAGFMLIVMSWFAALFAGRVPDGFQRFLVGVLRIIANVTAYEFLLSDQWPGLPFDPGPHDLVALEIEHVNLRRSAVFFRVILWIPALIINQCFSFGSVPFLVAMWFIGLVRGREPIVLHHAMALVLRFQIRTLAYAGLVTPTQPFDGMLGDDAERHSSTSVDPSESIDALDDGSSGLGRAPALDLPATDRLPVRLMVGSGAKAVLVVMLVLGGILWTSEQALISHLDQSLVVRPATGPDSANFQAAYFSMEALDATENTFVDSGEHCAAHLSTVGPCSQRLAGVAEKSVQANLEQLQSATVPSAQTQQAMDDYQRALGVLVARLRTVASSPSFPPAALGTAFQGFLSAGKSGDVLLSQLNPTTQ